MTVPAWTIERGDGPLVAAAIHAGHALRPEVAARLALSDVERRREEDPHTDVWTALAPTRIVVHRSRFEVDLNRPRERAVYRRPEDAWGLELWREPPDAGLRKRSLALHDAFYAEVDALVAEKVRAHGRALVLDLHSYNHRRDGPDAPPADPAANPEFNLGTASLDRARWGGVVEACLAGMRRAGLDARENVKFGGGHFVRHLHAAFPGTVCGLAIEFKKTFMDEWTGTLDAERQARLTAALGGVLPDLRAALAGVTP